MSRTTRARPAAVAGTFYPRDPDALTTAVDDAIAGAAKPRGVAPKALVVPHAGYAYSGPVAGSAYATLAPGRDVIRRVVLLGPAHSAGVRGLALSSAETFVTPLGAVQVDRELRTRVQPLPGVTVDDRAHATEHSLEVQLPFLQRTLPDFAVLPILVGRADADTVAEVLETVWGGPDTLIVVSSDLSHYLDHATAAGRDRATADAVVAGNSAALTSRDACGVSPLRGLLVAAARHDLRAQLLDLRSSGDTAGARQRVVGYGAFAFTPAGEA